jgi:hypothetical protein
MSRVKVDQPSCLTATQIATCICMSSFSLQANGSCLLINPLAYRRLCESRLCQWPAMIILPCGIILIRRHACDAMLSVVTAHAVFIRRPVRCRQTRPDMTSLILLFLPFGQHMILTTPHPQNSNTTSRCLALPCTHEIISRRVSILSLL